MDLRIIPGKNSLRPVAAAAFAVGILLIGTTAFALTAQPSATRSRNNTPGYLGIDVHDVSEDQQKVQGQQRGAEIVGMDHDGPACKSGMQVHDVILQMNGQAIEGEDQLRRMLRETPAGKQVTFLLTRDGQQRTVTTVMENREELERKAWEGHYVVPQPDGASAYQGRRGNSFLHGSAASATNALKEAHNLLGSSMIVSSSYTGAKLEVMGPQLAEFFGAQGSAGLLVREVDPNSPASSAGLKAGDVVISVNAQQVVNGSDWSKAIHDNRGKQVDVIVLREKREKTLTLVPDSKKRSSLEPGMKIEDFFGDSDQSLRTRAALAGLAPMFDAMSAHMQQRLEEARPTPAMMRLMTKLEMWSANPDFRQQLELAQHQVRAAAEAMRDDVISPELEQHIDRLRLQLHDVMQLD